MRREQPNRYERHQNKISLAKKERAKNRSVKRNNEIIELNQEWEKYESEQISNAQRGVVVQIRQYVFSVMSEDSFIDCTLSKKIPKHLGTRLVIGDKVHFEKRIDEQNGRIVGREPRKNSISRIRGDSSRFSAAAEEEHVVAANVDIGIIVAALINPEFHPRFVDRYLIALQNGKVDPVICINKCDLTSERPSILDWYKKMGIPVVETSAEKGIGLDMLKSLIHGKVAALVGNSGVGKSSLINLIVPDIEIDTKAVSQKTGRGRHTTTISALYKWSDDSYIIDTPGIRSLGLSNITKQELRFGFPEFDEYAKECRFSDCLHDKEPDCAVKKAFNEGLIDASRYESYLRMRNE